MIEKMKKTFHHTAEALEACMSVFVFIAIAIAIIGLFPAFREFWFHRTDTELLMDVLEQILSVVVAAEFISLLCNPSAENVTEVLVFMIARHMVVKETSALEGLIAVISITILLILRNLILGDRGPFRRKTEKE